ncbi:hypothetical protein [Microcoleus vaginatus]|uniref:hypothetical protein n=1 Tax=Microcoleus vaginatus TaxID=119532 RepID=UPI0002EBE086
MPNPFDSILRAIGPFGCMRLTESGRVRSALHYLRRMLVECLACGENTLDGRDAHPTV